MDQHPKVCFGRMQRKMLSAVLSFCKPLNEKTHIMWNFGNFMDKIWQELLYYFCNHACSRIQWNVSLGITSQRFKTASLELKWLAK